MKIKRLLSLILAFTFTLSCAFLNAYATEDAEFEVIFSNNEITISVEKGTSEEQKEAIIAHFTGADSSTAETRGILCTLFGHKLETTTSKNITHKVNATAPRCLMEVYDVSTCSRCNYTSQTLTSSTYINCCS